MNPLRAHSFGASHVPDSEIMLLSGLRRVYAVRIDHKAHVFPYQTETGMNQIFQIAAIALAMLGTGAATMKVMNEDIPDLQIPEGQWEANGTLDGRSFDILGVDTASGAVLEDLLIFRNGAFQSTDCQNYCDFGWSDYKTKQIDGVIYFAVTTVCPDAPHTVVFYGQVDGDDITVDATWTTRRWYWTNQIVLTATGQAMPERGDGVSG